MNPLIWQKRLRPLLAPFSRVYRALAALRRRRWEAPSSPAFRPSCPCISVGNIAWGGTGKTPVVDWLLGWGERRGLRMAVLSRGYRAAPPELPLHVLGTHTPQEAGDEPLMLARRHPGAVILVDPDRRRSGRLAESRFHPDIFLLDDGFQHVQVRRDLNLVLLRPDDLEDGWGRVIPAGAWREGPEALNRADAFLIKCDPAAFASLRPAFERHLAAFRRPLFGFSLHPTALRRVGGEGECRGFDGAYAVATGVGDPGQVRETVAGFVGRAPRTLLPFPDHHAFTEEDAAMLNRLRMPVICTDKDAVKLGRLPLSDVWSLQVEICFGPSLWCGQSFPDWFEHWFSRQCPSA